MGGKWAQAARDTCSLLCASLQPGTTSILGSAALAPGKKCELGGRRGYVGCQALCGMQQGALKEGWNPMGRKNITKARTEFLSLQVWVARGHTQWYSGFTPSSELRNYSWQGKGDHIGYQCSNLDQLHRRKAPYILYYSSSLKDPIAFKSLYHHDPCSTKEKLWLNGC